MKNFFNRRNIHEVEYRVGDQVLTKSMNTGKLEKKFTGPYVVIHSNHPVYKIKETFYPFRIKTIHHNNMYNCCTPKTSPSSFRETPSNQAVEDERNESQVIRKSTRIKRRPAYLEDYVCSSEEGANVA